MSSQWQKEFANPSSAYRGKPFWAWNGRLDPAELRRQIRIMHEMGLGGFFMHSRVGLDTAYLSEEWFDCVKACVDEARQLKMEAWMYDEDRWPSGAAGGLVTKNPAYRARKLQLEILDSAAKLHWQKETIAVFTARTDGGFAFDVERIAKGRKPGRLGKDRSVLVFSEKLEDCSSWHNGYTYLDTLNKDAVKVFLTVTHEAYRKQVGKDFGKTIPGMFTDEPNHMPRLPWKAPGPGGIRFQPWTGSLPQVFHERYGYDLIAHLPKLFFDVDGEAITQPRYHFHDCVTHLFVDSFSRQIGDWCEEHGIAHTGHVLLEDTLSSQTRVVGSCMRFYEYMQAPGMDLLTERWRTYDTAKQVSSVARQFGRKWRLTETYGCTGWDFSFAGHKALGDWQVALGINLRCQHLSWYTMEGEAKRDYPACILHQSPWWQAYGKVENYFARIHAVMTRGTEVRDVLVVHPVESMWCTVRAGWERSDEKTQRDNALISLRDTLLGSNIDFDYGDEDILARHSQVRGACLQVGKAKYTTVVVPPMLTMRRSTFDLLKCFQKAGGTVVLAGQQATHIDALPSDEIKDLQAAAIRTPAWGPKLAATVAKTGRRLSICDSKGKTIGATLHLLREDKDAAYLFVCNTGRDIARSPKGDEPRVCQRNEVFPNVLITGLAEFAGDPLELNPDTGEISKATAKRTSTGWQISTSFPELGSRLFVIPRHKEKNPFKLAKLAPVRQRRRLNPKQWQIRRSEANNLVLDKAEYQIGKGEWRKSGEILRIDREVREALGVSPRGGAMVQPWARPDVKNAKSLPLSLRYTFEVSQIPSGDLRLALEQIERYRISINGTSLSPDNVCGWWVDKSLKTLNVDPSSLRIGTNELLLSCDYEEAHPGLEIVYFLGNFGVRLRGDVATLTTPPTTLKLGDWCRQGLPFYSGNLSYVHTMNGNKKGRVFVQVPDYRGVGVRVFVDGQEAGVLAWQPNEVEITDFVHPGKCEIAIQILGHRRNSHGPLHLKDKWPAWTGPGQFLSEGRNWIEGYQVVPCGLMKPVEIVVR